MNNMFTKLYLSAAILFLSLSSLAQKDRPADLSFDGVVFGESRITFELPEQGPNCRYTATLHGPNDYRRTLANETQRSYDWVLTDIAVSGQVADGYYTLTFSPYFPIDRDSEKQLRRLTDQGKKKEAARLREHLQIPKHSSLLSFSIQVNDGKFLYPYLEERLFNQVLDKALHPGYTASVDGIASSLPMESRNQIPPVLGTGSNLSVDAFFDQVFNDELIVIASACIGFDCANGENFGFSTLRLKENNLRIEFDDTSTGSFPANDWILEANGTVNGGSNHFAIVDNSNARSVFKVEASARDNALYIDNAGRMGLGTENPVLMHHIVDGNTPDIRLEQDGSSGFSAQVWDLAGNESGFFVRDATNGSKLAFRIAPNSPGDAFFIKPSGIEIKNDIKIDGSILPISDRRIKTNIQPLASALPILMQLQAREYDFKKGDLATDLNLPAEHQYGLIAQEVEKILPHIVQNHFSVEGPDDRETQLKGINYTALIPFLVRGIQEQQAVIEQQEAELEQLRKKAASIDDLYHQLEKLSAQVQQLQQQQRESTIQN